MSKILITGAAGFVGSHLVERLLRDGHTIIGLDNFLTGSRENIALLSSHPEFSFVEHDIINPLTLSQKIDHIYNLACPASPVHYQADPIHTIKTNTIGVLNVLEFARAQGARVVQASTSEVYGDPEVHPQVEEYRGSVNPIGPRACYDEGKRVAETLCFDYRRVHKLDVKVIRIFNTYGPRMAPDDGRVVSNFIVQALRGEPLTLYGTGEQTRSFCYVTDLVEGIMRMMYTPPDMAGPINLGNPVEFTVRQLAEAVLKATGSASEMVYRDLPQDDPTRRQPDIRKARHHLQWEPIVALEEGLQKTIAYFKTSL